MGRSDDIRTLILSRSGGLARGGAAATGPANRGGNRMPQHSDTLETRTPEEREKALMQALPQQVAHAKANAPFFTHWLKDVDPATVTSRGALAKLPVLRKSMLGEV